jgi:hypothetical protein
VIESATIAFHFPHFRHMIFHHTRGVLFALSTACADAQFIVQFFVRVAAKLNRMADFALSHCIANTDVHNSQALDCTLKNLQKSLKSEDAKSRGQRIQSISHTTQHLCSPTITMMISVMRTIRNNF